ncbi:hypothetical protein CUR178_03519 [Leishmania enriettii]|uniref:RING-type domain-containing protein n=1 Tax=Leishmania enriettii TaxID=5663 RepID=A0A836KIS9_LEIEN|nr:hypothetical protein CUR178_03519 [Leishmania enriettii]
MALLRKCDESDGTELVGSSSASEVTGVKMEAAEPRPFTASLTPETAPVTAVDSTAVYENICGICFTDVHPIDNPRGRLNSCGHLFCSYCIKEWAKNTNVCPNCKARFTRIYTFHADSGKEEETKVRKRNYIAWETSYYDDGEGDDAVSEEVLPSSVVCDVCQKPHNAARMIFCDRRQCVFAAHLDCLSLEERPVTFLCTVCTKLREKEEDDHVPLADCLSAAALDAAAAAPETPAPPTPVSAEQESAPAPVRRRTAAPAAAAPAVATQTRHPVGLTATGDGDRSSEVPTGASSLLPPPSLAAAVPMRHVPRGTSHATLTHRDFSQGTSSSPSPSTGLPPVLRESSTASRAPVDFSKSHLHLMGHATTASRRRSRGAPSTTRTMAASEADDDYYFLAPTSHAVAARIELSRVRQARAAEAQTRRQRERAKAERLQEAYSVQHRDLVLGDIRKRAHRTSADEVTAELESAAEELRDPQQRRLIEERMVRKWAADMLPVLRRRRYVEGDTATTESDLWAQATAQARIMVREKLEAKCESLRRRREQLVRAQAQREAAALGKLARIIAQHRERSRRVTK